MSRTIIVTGFVVSVLAAAQPVSADEAVAADAAAALAMAHSEIGSDLSHSARFMFETFDADYALAGADRAGRRSAATDSRTALDMSQQEVGQELNRSVDFMAVAPDPSVPTLGVVGDDDLVAGALDAPDTTGGI